jgi:hypothetical protein
MADEIHLTMLWACLAHMETDTKAYGVVFERRRSRHRALSAKIQLTL